jgi:hypothetical protein
LFTAISGGFAGGTYTKPGNPALAIRSKINYTINREVTDYEK